VESTRERPVILLADFWTWAEKLIEPQTLVAVGTLLGLYFSHKKQSANIGEVKKDVATIEKATNSMKDALVQSTHDAAFLQGKNEERVNPELAVEVKKVTDPATAIRKDIAGIPEKTADKVVEKMKEEEGSQRG